MDTKPQKESFSKKYGLLIAFAALIIIFMIPTPLDLTTAGHRMLGILIFAVIIWITEAVTYPVSATLIASLMILCLGFAPNPQVPTKMLGTSGALKMAFTGLSSSGTILVGAALFLAAAMMHTGLDRRIALFILSKVGAKTNRVLAGMIFVGFILAFFVPSTTARVGCIVPIILGIIAAFHLKPGSRLAALLMVATVEAASIWNIGIKTAAAQNMVALGFIEKQLGATISWAQWFITAAPYAAIMSVILYFLCIKILPPEMKEIEGGEESVRKEQQELGPMKPSEKRLLIVSVGLLFLWVTEKTLHPLDTTTSTILAITLLFMPKIGVMTWKEAQSRVSWGTLILFGVGISMGTALLTTKAAAWLATHLSSAFGLTSMSLFSVFAILALFLIVIHIGFASATAVASSMIPIMIAVLQGLGGSVINIVATTMVLQFVVSFGFILPVNSPQGILAFATDTFSAKDCIKVGLPLTIIGYILLLVFAATYWKFLGIF